MSLYESDVCCSVGSRVLLFALWLLLSCCAPVYAYVHGWFVVVMLFSLDACVGRVERTRRDDAVSPMRVRMCRGRIGVRWHSWIDGREMC